MSAAEGEAVSAIAELMNPKEGSVVLAARATEDFRISRRE
jgi:hypothetical protein